MPLPGEGFIALWNDIDSSRSDYDQWHTIEHVPERMTVSGFLRAYRYIRSHGNLPRYFTLYALDDLEALNSQAYRRLIAEPTAWSRNMRPNMRNFIRWVCRTLATRGEGVGGFAALSITPRLEAQEAEAICEELLAKNGVSAVHFGVVEVGARALDIAVEQVGLPPDAAGLFIVEGYSEASLLSSCKAVERSIFKRDDWALYKLAFELRDIDGPPAAKSGSRRTGRAKKSGSAFTAAFPQRL